MFFGPFIIYDCFFKRMSKQQKNAKKSGCSPVIGIAHKSRDHHGKFLRKVSKIGFAHVITKAAIKQIGMEKLCLLLSLLELINSVVPSSNSVDSLRPMNPKIKFYA